MFQTLLETEGEQVLPPKICLWLEYSFELKVKEPQDTSFPKTYLHNKAAFVFQTAPLVPRPSQGLPASCFRALTPSFAQDGTEASAAQLPPSLPVFTGLPHIEIGGFL